jgi:hypothetical protein
MAHFSGLAYFSGIFMFKIILILLVKKVGGGWG